MNIGDIVIAIDCKSLPESFLGRYGVVTNVMDYSDDTKVMVEFGRQIKYVGSLFHTARESDLEKIGETNY